MIDLSNVFPRIKGLSGDQDPDLFGVENKNETPVSFNDNPVIKPLAMGIGVCYMLEETDGHRIIQNSELSDRLTIDQLHEAALTNMTMAISDQTHINGEPGNAMMVTSGGNYEAAIILSDYICDQFEIILNDSICVAIPANDLLFVTAKQNPEGRKNLIKVVRHYFDDRETVGLIVRHIYERTAGGWLYVETA